MNARLKKAKRVIIRKRENDELAVWMNVCVNEFKNSTLHHLRVAVGALSFVSGVKVKMMTRGWILLKSKLLSSFYQWMSDCGS